MASLPDDAFATFAGDAPLHLTPAVRTKSSEAAGNLRPIAEMRDCGLLTDAKCAKRHQRELKSL